MGMGLQKEDHEQKIIYYRKELALSKTVYSTKQQTYFSHLVIVSIK